MGENITSLLSPGNVFASDLAVDPVRIIACDGLTVFYEAWWSHEKDWSYKCNLNGRVIYYRSSVQNFLRGASYFRNDPLSQEELNVHRPDLPLYLCRNGQMSWTTVTYPTTDQFEEENRPALQQIISFNGLQAEKIILVPSGPKGALKKGTIIEAKNGMGFTCVELLWNAQNIQANYSPHQITPGIGIYRLGYQKRLPTFCTGGFYDAAGVLEDSEST